MPARKKSGAKAVATKQATSEAESEKEAKRRELEFTGKMWTQRYEDRVREAAQKGDSETRRRIIRAIGHLPDACFNQPAEDAFDVVSTRDELEQAVMDMVCGWWREIGSGRMAELSAAILNRFANNAGKPNINEPLANDLLATVKAWSCGVETPSGVIIRPGMQVACHLEGGARIDGKVILTCEPGCFVEEDNTGEVFGCTWREVLIDLSDSPAVEPVTMKRKTAKGKAKTKKAAAA